MRKDQHLMLRLDGKMKRKLAKVAEEEDRSMSSVIRRAIDADLSRRQQGAAA